MGVHRSKFDQWVMGCYLGELTAVRTAGLLCCMALASSGDVMKGKHSMLCCGILKLRLLFARFKSRAIWEPDKLFPYIYIYIQTPESQYGLWKF